MSKKAKLLKRSQKRNKTIVDGLKCEVNNYKALYEQASDRARVLEAEITKVSGQADEAGQRTRSLIDQKSASFQAISDLKLIIAGNERDIAERDGALRELRRQIDQAAPKVMVKPAVFVSPGEAHRAEYRADASLLRNMEAEMMSPKKHWTAL